LFWESLGVCGFRGVGWGGGFCFFVGRGWGGGGRGLYCVFGVRVVFGCLWWGRVGGRGGGGVGGVGRGVALERWWVWGGVGVGGRGGGGAGGVGCVVGGWGVGWGWGGVRWCGGGGGGGFGWGFLWWGGGGGGVFGWGLGWVGVGGCGGFVWFGGVVFMWWGGVPDTPPHLLPALSQPKSQAPGSFYLLLTVLPRFP